MRVSLDRFLRRAVILPALVMMMTAQPAVARDLIQSFLLAARADDTTVLRQMAELGYAPGLKDDLGNTLLMMAIREGGERLALGLLQQPAWKEKEILEHENRLGENALMLAAIKGVRPVAEELIRLGAEVNRQGWTPLHYAATNGHVSMIQLLVDHAAYVDATSPNGTTPIMMAARFNHRPAAAALIEAGADPTQSNQSGLTARDYANQNNNKDLAFWIEGEEIAFTNRYLNRLSKKNFESLDAGKVQTKAASSSASGSKDSPDVVTVAPSKPPVVEDPKDKPKGDVEVFGGIR